MILNRRAALNGVWLDELDNRIVISGIEPGDGKDNITASTKNNCRTIVSNSKRHRIEQKLIRKI